MPNPHTALPTAQDVRNHLARLPKPITLNSAYDVESDLTSAIAEWDRLTYRPFFQTSNTPVAVPFDPPGPNQRGSYRGGDTRLPLRNGLLSVTSVYVGVNEADGQDGNLLVAGSDYWLYPSDAPSKNEPFTEIEFAFARRGLPQSIVVTGIWGYCQGEIPDDAWKAIRDMACANVLRSVREGNSYDYVQITDGDVTLKNSESLLDQLGDGLYRNAMRCRLRYRLF